MIVLLKQYTAYSASVSAVQILKIYRSNRMLTIDHRQYKTAANGTIVTFPLIYSLFSRTYTVSICLGETQREPTK